MMNIPKNLYAGLSTNVAENGGRTAMVADERVLTFADLKNDIDRMARALTRAGVKKGDSLAIVLRNSPEFVITYFALGRIGAIAVPINYLVSKPSELQYMLKDSGSVGFVTQREFTRGLLKCRKENPNLRIPLSVDSEDPDAGLQRFESFLATGDGAPEPSVEVGPDDVTAVLYTSGTTGNPKGVMLTHSNLISNALSAVESIHISRKDVHLVLLPMFHTFAWTAHVIISMLVGCKMVIVQNIAPPKPWLSLMARHGVTLFGAVPQIYSVLAKEAKGIKGLVLRWWFFRKVKIAVSGAAPLPKTTLNAFRDKFGLSILEGYGLTETSPVATINTPDARKDGTVGKPIRDVSIKIIDENEKELGVGEEGEICIKGPNVMKGYLNLPDATKDAFTADGFFRTGDVGVVDTEGFLAIRDRIKDMIIVKGLKVFPAQLEAKILQHPAVGEVAVIGIPGQDGDERIKCFVVKKPGESVEKQDLMKFFRENLDPYKRPRDVEFLDELPKNALQKVLKRVLRKQEIEKLSNVS